MIMTPPSGKTPCRSPSIYPHGWAFPLQLLGLLECGFWTDCHAPAVQLCDLYENDCIFDKFNCCMNGAGDQVATGTYSNQLKLLRQDNEWPGHSALNLEASRDPLRKRQNAPKVCRVLVEMCK